MATLLLKNAHAIATFDVEQRELRDASILLRDNVIEAIGPAGEVAWTLAELLPAAFVKEQLT